MKYKIDTKSETHNNSGNCYCYECCRKETKQFLEKAKQKEESYVLENQRREERKSKT